MADESHVTRKTRYTDDNGCSGNGLQGVWATVKRAVGTLFSSGKHEADWQRPVDRTELLQITSPCTGSFARIARPRSKGTGWDGFCAVCKRPITVDVAEAEQAPKRSRRDRCAFVIVLWGSSPEYVTGAMILAHSLRATGTLHDLVLLHTSDVSDAAVTLMERAGWKARKIEHIDASPALSKEGCCLMRFAKVFTKLRALELTEYSKILLMDIDLLVCGNIDDLFEQEAPMALVRGPQVGYTHGMRVQGSYFFAGSRNDHYSWGQASGINAGVMLLTPDAEVFDQMVLEVADSHHPEHIAGNGPEQDYLSRFYASDWRHLSVAYNFQLHQMYFALNPANTKTADRTEFIFEPERIKVFHYSSEPKPWTRHLEEKYSDYSDEKWLEEVSLSFNGYRAWVLGEVDCMQREAERAGLAVGPDGKLHRIDWEKMRAKQAEEHQDDKTSSTDVSDTKTLGDARPDDAACLVSEDGYLLGEVIPVSEDAIKGAARALKLSQDLWFGAYEALSKDLGEANLAQTVRAATTGPLIRQDWDWSSGQAVDKLAPSNSADYAAGWTREGTGGWWVEGPASMRLVATCRTLPQMQASLSSGASLLHVASTEGVHLAACSGGQPCPAASFLPGPGSASAASEWVNAVPDGAMVLLAVIDTSDRGENVAEILNALCIAGLGCPTSLPAECTVAAAVGKKGVSKWYTTHAAAHFALATCPAASSQ